MIVKLTLLITVAVSSVSEAKPVCRYGQRHKLPQVVCESFTSREEWKADLSAEPPSERLLLRNATGPLDLSDVTLPRLKSLSFAHSNIDDLTLGNFSELIFLTLWKNNIFPNLTRDFFAPVTQINWLSLVSNNHSIEPDAFHLLRNLSWTHVQNQPLEHLSREYFKRNPKLHELSIRNCGLRGIDVDAFDGTPDLEILSVNFNQIDYFEAGTFGNLRKLKILELHHNRFVRFDLQQFYGLVSLEVLGLPSNFLRNIVVDDLLTSLPNLRKMEVKKKDLNSRGHVRTIIKHLRRRGIHIIGTPHDCHHPASCRII